MFLFPNANRLDVATVGAGVVVPERVRSVEVPVVRKLGADLLTRPKVEGRSES